MPISPSARRPDLALVLALAITLLAMLIAPAGTLAKTRKGACSTRTAAHAAKTRHRRPAMRGASRQGHPAQAQQAPRRAARGASARQGRTRGTGPDAGAVRRRKQPAAREQRLLLLR